MKPELEPRDTGLAALLRRRFDRRRLLTRSTAGLVGLGTLGAGAGAVLAGARPDSSHVGHAGHGAGSRNSQHHGGHAMMAVGDVDTEAMGYDPSAFLTTFNYGNRVSTLPNGQTLREYQFTAVDNEIEIAPGLFFPAWAYQG